MKRSSIHCGTSPCRSPSTRSPCPPKPAASKSAWLNVSPPSILRRRLRACGGVDVLFDDREDRAPRDIAPNIVRSLLASAARKGRGPKVLASEGASPISSGVISLVVSSPVSALNDVTVLRSLAEATVPCSLLEELVRPALIAPIAPSPRARWATVFAVPVAAAPGVAVAAPGVAVEPCPALGLPRRDP